MSVAMRKLRNLLLGVCVCLLILNLVLFFKGEQMVLLWINGRAGCYPWSPREVEYKPGMTLCPGQSTTVGVPMIAPRQKDHIRERAHGI
jgi:hypothetical protein